jgi:hypothetical protein
MVLEGRCMKCKETREMKNYKIEPTKRGTMMAKGICTVCGTKMAKILSKEQAAAVKKSA